ncbi:MAG: PEP/pyruvate-binding domain-containing protein [Rhabdochlamydiaceae bacterium]
MHNGGKADSLLRLQEGGFLVPPFFICDVSWSEKMISEKIAQDLPDTEYFAVRSSAGNEDSNDKSFAGHFYSAVGVQRSDVSREIAKVSASFKGVSGSVIVQKFIPSEKAGVMFTQVEGDTMVINSTVGLCLSVVNGEACDEYLLKNHSVVHKTIAGEKPIKLFKNGEIISQNYYAESLDASDIKKLVNLGVQIQEFFSFPQDIEWCIADGKLYILQSRPITRDFGIGSEEYFDSANIAESYSGIVLPLTCSFASMVYEQVYKDLLRMSGVSHRKLEAHSVIFKNLLGFFYGRMYYNMSNWYYMTAFVPGYRRNKSNLELMITSNVKADISISIKPSILLRIFYPLIVFFKTCLFGVTSKYFEFVVERKIKRLRNYDFSHLSYEDCLNLFEDLQHNLLRRWYITVENDFFVMTYLGLLTKLLDGTTLQKAIAFPSKATEQVAALAELSERISRDKILWDAVESNNTMTFRKQLSVNPEAAASLQAYLVMFGVRFANELKLESVGVDEDTSKLFAVLKAYSQYKPEFYAHEIENTLPFFKKTLSYFILRKFKKYAQRREEFRLLRSNTFGIVRTLFRRMGVLLAEQGVIAEEKDVFYLHTEETLDHHALNNHDLKARVEKRKSEYSQYKRIYPPAHFAAIDGVPPSIPKSTSIINVLGGRPASPGIVRGKIRVFKEFFMPNDIDFDILVTSYTDPGWTSLIALSKGLIIEHGGVLSHASIVARELNIPAVIGAINATDLLKNGQMVEINGSTGSIKVI